MYERHYSGIFGRHNSTIGLALLQLGILMMMLPFLLIHKEAASPTPTTVAQHPTQSFSDPDDNFTGRPEAVHIYGDNWLFVGSRITFKDSTNRWFQVRFPANPTYDYFNSWSHMKQMKVDAAFPDWFNFDHGFVVTAHAASGSVYRFRFTELPAKGYGRRCLAFYAHVCGEPEKNIPLRPRLYLNGLNGEASPDSIRQ